MLSPSPVLLRAITVPSNAWRRSLSPSLILTCTRMVSPGLNVGRSARLFFCMNFDINAFCMTISLIFYLTLRGRRFAGPIEQIRAQPRSLLPGRLPAKASNLLVISVQQHLWRLPSPEIRGPGPVGTVPQTLPVSGFLQGLKGRRPLIPQHSRKQPRDRTHDHRRRQFASAQYVASNRNFIVRDVFRHALVHAFVSPANQKQLRFPRDTVGHRLMERSP